MAQGNDNGVTSTNTIDFIHKHEVPKDRDITYATFVLDHRPLKTEEFRIRITVGGNRLSYAEDSGSPAANLLEANLKGAILTNANFEETDLMWANLNGADLQNTRLDGAYLQGANLKDTRIIQEQIKLAFIDEDTQLPDNIRQPL